MSAAVVTIRRAVAADAASISAFAAHVFSDWYEGDNTPEDMALHVARTFSLERQQAELAEPSTSYLLAEIQGELAGYALLRTGSAHALVQDPAPAEVSRFYVARAWHGRGVASTLMDAALAAARAAGARALWLTTWERNARARAFYAKAGFADVGTATFLLGREPQVDRVLVRTLD